MRWVLWSGDVLSDWPVESSVQLVLLFVLGLEVLLFVLGLVKAWLEPEVMDVWLLDF